MKHVVKAKKTSDQGARPVVEWTFQRGTQTLTCQVAKARRRAYAVALVPHWDVRSTAVESFGQVTSAMRRHAAIAEELRNHGWTIRTYTAA